MITFVVQSKEKIFRIFMKRSSQLVLLFTLLIAISAIYRVIPFDARPVWLGAPQLAIALFAGSIIKDRKWAFAVPLFSMLISDLFIQALYSAGAVVYPGFYKGMFINYVFISLLTVVGFFVNHRKAGSVFAGMVAAPTVYFLLSNFAVWVSGGGLQRPKTPAGLLQCYVDGLPFYGYSLLTMAIFGTALFAGYFLFYPVLNPVKVKA
jgi:hypothetical protein